MADSVLKVIVTAVDNFTAAFDKMASRAGEIGKRFEKVGKTVTKAVTLPIIALGAASVKVGADFEKGMTNVSTLVDTTVEDMEAMGQAVQDIGTRASVDLMELPDALYAIRSAGIGADRALTDLEKSAQLGVAGLGSTAQAADIATSAMNSFGLEGEQADAVYGQVFTAVKFGKTTISELSRGFGDAASQVAANNIKFEEFMATTAALTTTGMKASSAYTKQVAILSGLTRQTEMTQKVFKKLGVKDFPELVTKAGGFRAALMQVTQGLGVTGVSGKQASKALRNLGVKSFDQLVKKTGSVEAAYAALSKEMGSNNKALLKAFGSTEALGAALALTGAQSEDAQKAFDAMADGSDEMAKAFAKQSKTQAAQWQRTKNIMAAAGIQIGKILAPVVAKLAGALEKLSLWFQGLDEDTKEWIITIAGIAAAVGPALIVVGKMAQGIKGVSDAIKGIGKAFDFVGALVTKHPLLAAIAALAAGAILIIQNWDEIVEFFSDLWDNVVGFFENGVESIKDSISAAIELPKLLLEVEKNSRELTKKLDAQFEAREARRDRERGQRRTAREAPIGGDVTVPNETTVTNETTVRIELANAPAGTRVRQEGAGVDLSVGFQLEGAQ